MRDLFRKEVVERQTNRLYGDVILSQSSNSTVAFFALMAAIVSAFVLLSNVNYGERVTVRGWLEPTGGVVGVRLPTSSELLQMMVKEGDFVEAGQPVMSAQLSLDHKNRRIANYIRNIGLLNENLIDITNTQRARIEKLVSLLSDWQKNTPQSIKSSIDGYYPLLNHLEAEAEELEAQINDEHLHLVGFATEMQALEEGYLTLAREAPYEILAPISGIVSSSHIWMGALPGPPNRPSLVIFASDQDLVAKLLLPARISNLVTIGDQIVLATNETKSGPASLKGTILSISQNTLYPAELPDLPFQIQEPVILVSLDIEAQANLKDSYAIGDILYSEVAFNNRPIIWWLFESLLKRLGHSI